MHMIDWFWLSDWVLRKFVERFAETCEFYYLKWESVQGDGVNGKCRRGGFERGCFKMPNCTGKSEEGMDLEFGLERKWMCDPFCLSLLLIFFFIFPSLLSGASTPWKYGNGRLMIMISFCSLGTRETFSQKVLWIFFYPPSLIKKVCGICNDR